MAAVLGLLVMACGTGIEISDKVPDKEVKRVSDQAGIRQDELTLDAYVDSLPAWKTGKRFWVADNQIKLLFANTGEFDLDTVPLAGHILEYVGYDTGGLYDNRLTVNIMFRDRDDGKTYVYRTGRTIDEFGHTFSIPMLIDLDMVDHIARQAVGKEYYIRTDIWYHPVTEQMITGRHFIKVHIDSVLPGNGIMPLRLIFTTADTHQQAMVWMSDNASTMHGRDFDALFVSRNPREDYPTITDDNWERITRGLVVEGMTKDECRLAMGSPRRISERPDQGGMREYWYYDGGCYLFFVDGLLSQFRR